MYWPRALDGSVTLAAAPGRASPKIFISYRRDDVAATAARICDRLTFIVGPKSIFFDIDNLRPGERFDEKLIRALDESNVFLAIIGPKWLQLLEERERAKQIDYVRQEIQLALSKEMLFVPVIVDNARLPEPNVLPADIRSLAMHQKHEVAHERFGRDVDALVEAIGIRSTNPASGNLAPIRWQARQLRWPIVAAISAAFIIIAAQGHFLGGFAAWVNAAGQLLGIADQGPRTNSIPPPTRHIRHRQISNPKP